jgi:hypothetical protein
MIMCSKNKSKSKSTIKRTSFHLGQTVYHREVYERHEPLVVVGIRENELELEGDYSGGIYPEKQKAWLPIKGVSTMRKNIYS